MNEELAKLYHLAPSVAVADIAILDFGLAARKWILSTLPSESIGAEIGVFTGMFSECILQIVRPKKLYLVDIWTEMGEYFGDWGIYTDHGRLKTEDAKSATRIRVQGYQGGTVEIIESDCCKWINSLDDHSLDWVYLDTSHTYDDTLKELRAVASKIRPSGVIIGDDWQREASHPHGGVRLAVNDFVRTSEFDICLAGEANQWLLQRRPSALPSVLLERTALPDGLYPFLDQRIPLSDLTFVEVSTELDLIFREQAARSNIEFVRDTPIELSCQLDNLPDPVYLLFWPTGFQKIHVLVPSNATQESWGLLGHEL